MRNDEGNRGCVYSRQVWCSCRRNPRTSRWTSSRLSLRNRLTDGNGRRLWCCLRRRFLSRRPSRAVQSGYQRETRTTTAGGQDKKQRRRRGGAWRKNENGVRRGPDDENREAMTGQRKQRVGGVRTTYLKDLIALSLCAYYQHITARETHTRARAPHTRTHTHTHTHTRTHTLSAHTRTLVSLLLYVRAPHRRRWRRRAPRHGY